MSNEEIFESIDVITLFDRGGLQPLKFRWNGRVYKIAEVQSIWSLPRNQHRTFHFAVRSDGPEYFEIIFDSQNFAWQLARVSVAESWPEAGRDEAGRRTSLAQYPNEERT